MFLVRHARSLLPATAPSRHLTYHALGPHLLPPRTATRQPQLAACSYHTSRAALGKGNNPRISCQCGTISFQAASPKPIEKYVCHCKECQKQSASAFSTSAIFPSEDVWPLPKQLHAHLQLWARPADSGNTVECYFCKVCGVRILHRVILKDGKPRPTISVRGGCVDGFDLQGAKHIYTRSALIPVPEGSSPGPPAVRPGMAATTK